MGKGHRIEKRSAHAFTHHHTHACCRLAHSHRKIILLVTAKMLFIHRRNRNYRKKLGYKNEKKKKKKQREILYTRNRYRIAKNGHTLEKNVFYSGVVLELVAMTSRISQPFASAFPPLIVSLVDGLFVVAGYCCCCWPRNQYEPAAARRTNKKIDVRFWKIKR